VKELTFELGCDAGLVFACKGIINLGQAVLESGPTFCKKAGVGVWIDVVKLCPGDGIRPVVRTTVKRVHKVIVFLCDEYCQSINCCVEMMEAMQHPEKVTVCIIKPNIHPEIMKFLINLKPRGLRMCVGFDELISLLDLDLQDQSDIAAFQWWRNSGIGAPAVPENLVPSGWPMSRFSFLGKVFLPEKSVDVGPSYISGDCRETGKALALPWLLFISIIGVGINLYDFLDKFYNSNELHTDIDYVFLIVVSGTSQQIAGETNSFTHKLILIMA
jgi:hypothetical protein